MFSRFFQQVLTCEDFSLEVSVVLGAKVDVWALADNERVAFIVRIARQCVWACWCDVRPPQGVLHALDRIVDCGVLSDVVDVLTGCAQNQTAFDFELIGIRDSTEGSVDSAFWEHTVVERLLRQHVVRRIELARHQIDVNGLGQVGDDIVENLETYEHVFGVEGSQRQRAHVLLLLWWSGLN